MKWFPESRFTVRVGDDGKIKRSYASLGEAREYAKELSSQGLGVAQIRDTADNYTERYRNGERI